MCVTKKSCVIHIKNRQVGTVMTGMYMRLLFCHIEEFNLGKESNPTYEERVALLFQANDVAEDKSPSVSKHCWF